MYDIWCLQAGAYHRLCFWVLSGIPRDLSYYPKSLQKDTCLCCGSFSSAAWHEKNRIPVMWPWSLTVVLNWLHSKNRGSEAVTDSNKRTTDKPWECWHVLSNDSKCRRNNGNECMKINSLFRHLGRFNWFSGNNNNFENTWDAVTIFLKL